MSDNLEPEALPQSEVSQDDNLERNLVFIHELSLPRISSNAELIFGDVY